MDEFQFSGVKINSTIGLERGEPYFRSPLIGTPVLQLRPDLVMSSGFKINFKKR
jgi:hypothetical protein